MDIGTARPPPEPDQARAGRRAGDGAHMSDRLRRAGAADTLLLTVPNQLGVEYNAHAIESILKYVAPGLGWR